MPSGCRTGGRRLVRYKLYACRFAQALSYCTLILYPYANNCEERQLRACGTVGWLCERLRRGKRGKGGHCGSCF